MDALRAASDLLAGGRADLAEPLVRRGLQEDPDHPVGHALLALCRAQGGRLDEAEREAREAVRLAPDLAFVHYVHGTVLLRARRTAEAEQAACRALELLPEDEGNLDLLGRVRLAQKRPAEALELALRGLQVDPNDLNCLNLRIGALRALGRNAEAQLAAREILQRHPEDELSHIQAGIARSQVLDYGGARAHFGEALRIDPTNDGVARAFKGRHPGCARVAAAAGVFAAVGAVMPWTNAALTGRCLSSLTWILPLVAVGGAWGRGRRLFLAGGAVALLLGAAWAAFLAGRLVEARAALAAAAVASLVPAALGLREV